jgi:hypothetical protein
MKLSIAFLAMILFSATAAEARYNYGGGSHSGSHGGQPRGC